MTRMLIVAAIALTTCHASAAQGTAPNTKIIETPIPDSSITFAISNDASMPLAEFRGFDVVKGILKDVGDAIAAETHRKAKYVVIPRKRLDAALAKGTVDGVCYYRPEWVETKVNWSEPLIPNDILLVSSSAVPRPDRVEDLAGKTIGVVLGYKYPELDALKNNYQREDAPNMPLNVDKLLVGHVQYAVVDQMSLDFQQKLHPELAGFARLSITKIEASCGFSLASKIQFDELKRAIQRLKNRHAIEAILAQYR